MNTTIIPRKNNIIKENDKQVDFNFEDFKIKLFPHQKATIQKMIDFESKGIIEYEWRHHGDNLKSFIDDLVRRYDTNVNQNLGVIKAKRNEIVALNNETFKLQTNIGVLANEVGSGKTINVLGLIEYNKYKEMPNDIYNALYNTLDYVPKDIIDTLYGYYDNGANCMLNTCDNDDTLLNLYNPKMCQGKSRFDMYHDPPEEEVKEDLDDELINTNLIVVPHNLYNQWLDEIKSKTNLKVFGITTKRHIAKIINDGYLNKDFLNEYDIILCNINKYKEIFKLTKRNQKWHRVFVDEADDIKISKCPQIRSDFLWCLTATPSRLYRGREGFIGYIFSEWFILNSLVFKCDKDFLNKSKNYTKPKYVYHTIPTPYLVERCFELIKNKKSLSYLVAGDIYELNRRHYCEYKLNPLSDTTTVISLLYSKYLRIINSNTRKITLDRPYIRMHRDDYDSMIRKNNRTINNFEKNYETLCDSINQYDKFRNHFIKFNYCVCCNKIVPTENYDKQLCICYTGQHPRGMKGIAVNRIFTYEDKVKYEEYANKSANREYLKKYKLICNNSAEEAYEADVENYIREDMKNSGRYEELEEKTDDFLEETDLLDINIKLTTLFTELEKDIAENNKALIFSDNLTLFKNVALFLKKRGIKAYELKGNNNTIKKRVRLFTDGDINFLLLNTKYMGAGTNLQAASKIYIMNYMDLETETQVIGRANRHGREGDLEVHYINFEIEKKMYDERN